MRIETESSVKRPLLYSACQECHCSLHKTEGDQQRSLIWTLRQWQRESSQEWWVLRSLCVCMRVYSFQCTVPAKSASSMSSLTTKGRVVKTKTISTGSLWLMCTCIIMDIELLILTGASISQPTHSASAKETRGGVSIGLPARKGGKIPVKNCEFSWVLRSFCVCMMVYTCTF